LIKILNQNRQPVAILENAYDIGYEKGFNQLWLASFSLPLDDEKNDLCKPLYYVEVYDNGEYVGLFRIMPKRTVKNESENYASYECEHVLGLLLNTSLFMDHQLTNLTTEETLQYLLDQQRVKHFELGRVQFIRYFHYLWENENLLSAIFSVPKPFDVQYEWHVDTLNYPWKLELLAPETTPTAEIRKGKNLIGLDLEENPMDIYNRIYPLGEGEGINQLTVKSVNNGIPYIEDSASVSEHGPIEYIWPDRRFIDANTLKASAEALLKKWKEPIVTWSVSAADISSITGESIDKFRVGKIVRLNVEGFPPTDLRIMKESKSDVTGNPGNIQLEIGSVVEDLGTTYSDLRQRQRINELYAQGATNIDSANAAENADETHPVIVETWLPEEVAKVNTFKLTFRIEKFRAYEKTIEAAGSVVSTTGSGGGSVKTTTSGGGTSTSTASDGNHSHRMLVALAGPVQGLPNSLFAGKNSAGQTINVEMPANNVDLYTYDSSGSHSHTFSVPEHNHSITLEAHSHSIQIPEHSHGIQYGIYESPEEPTAVTIKVNGVTVPHTATSGENIDLVPYLPKDSDGNIQRGVWLKVEIKPNNLGRVVAQVFKQVFIRSRGQYTL